MDQNSFKKYWLYNPGHVYLLMKFSFWRSRLRIKFSWIYIVIQLLNYVEVHMKFYWTVNVNNTSCLPKHKPTIVILYNKCMLCISCHFGALKPLTFLMDHAKLLDILTLLPISHALSVCSVLCNVTSGKPCDIELYQHLSIGACASQKMFIYRLCLKSFSKCFWISPLIIMFMLAHNKVLGVLRSEMFWRTRVF